MLIELLVETTKSKEKHDNGVREPLIIVGVFFVCLVSTMFGQRVMLVWENVVPLSHDLILIKG